MNGQKPIADPEKREENSVRKMFARIAPFYDVINRAMTFGLDVVWRKRLIRKLGLPCGKTRVADLACGSGDVAVEILRRHPNAEVVCADFCPPMLDAAKAKLSKKGLANRVEFVEADCGSLPFGNEIFDGATISFGFRNFRNRADCLREIARTLKPSAKLCVLEVCRAGGALEKIQKLFMGKFVPNVAVLFGGKREDYVYLAETTLAYPPREKVEEMFCNAGFENVQTRPMAFGFVAITSGEKSKK